MCPNGWAQFCGFLDDWQTLITGILAVIGAAIGAAYLHAQIRQTWSIENVRRARKRAALRAVMPLALARIVEYSKSCAETLQEFHSWSNGRILSATGKTEPTIPNLPEETITILSQFIEYSQPGETVLIEDLLREIQVQSGRLRDIFSDICRLDVMVTKDNIEDYLIDTAGVYARASACFNFARGLTDKLPTEVSWDNVRSALRNLRVYDTQYPGVYEQINKAAETSAGPKRFAPPGSAARTASDTSPSSRR